MNEESKSRRHFLKTSAGVSSAVSFSGMAGATTMSFNNLLMISWALFCKNESLSK